MGSTTPTKPTFTTALLPPPGPSLTRPTLLDPSPQRNPPLFNDAMHVRTVVFVDEQRCVLENEMDADDARSWHWVLYNDQQKPVGVIRLVPPPHAAHEDVVKEYSAGVIKGFDGKEVQVGERSYADSKNLGSAYVKLTRVALLKEYRGMGLARVLIDTALEWAVKNWRVLGEGEGKPWSGLVLVHAQVVAEGMYARLGFVTDKSMDIWVEEGIEHVGMWKQVDMSGTS
ncbi:hypothetical protein AJ79_05287 [Helicocarpus griseus UAMH5409]|uniref:N-acetyltransferase domain-containing protein n=1 Tax=Helicocarpus griseus UAMH5409 TaxID=1447875 RepID=A0A2B7XNF9_9EURO|nr:hypothetical protein AJ79_05287 [Helicocarpus griseus UAMH5409]